MLEHLYGNGLTMVTRWMCDLKMEKNQLIPIEDKGEIVLYQPDDNVRLEVRLQDDTVWLTQQQMTELFKTTKQNVSLHINNIFREGELTKNSVVKESLTTAGDGKNYRTKYYRDRY